MNRITAFFFITVSIFLLFISCTSNEIGNAKDVNPESIYFDYKVWGDEESDEMVVKLQYRFAGPNGTTLLLENPSRVELDGVVIKADSSKMNGAYYEVSKPVKGAAGKHSIVFTDMNKKQYREEFSFQTLLLKTNLPKVVKRGDLIFDITGLAPQDYVHVMLTDTASFSEGIDRIDTVKNGRVFISKKDLKDLVNGPIQFEISKEDERRIKNGTKQGGKFSFSYAIRREFELKD
jgi:hypothetical protein